MDTNEPYQTIFQVYIGLEPLTSSGLAGTATTVLAITNYLGVYYMEKFGRRTWLITGAVVQTIFMATFTGLLSSPGTKTGAAAAAMLFIWIAVFGPTWGPVTVSTSFPTTAIDTDYDSTYMPLRLCPFDTVILDLLSACRPSGSCKCYQSARLLPMLTFTGLLPPSLPDLSQLLIRVLDGRLGFGSWSLTSLPYPTVSVIFKW